jgi:hypothetical protein
VAYLPPLNAKVPTNKKALKELGNGSEEVSKMTPPKLEKLNNNEALMEFQNTIEEGRGVSKMTPLGVTNMSPFTAEKTNFEALAQDPKYILLNINRDISIDISREPSLIKTEKKGLKKKDAPKKEGAPKEAPAPKDPPVPREKMLKLIKAFCDEMGFQFGEASIKVNVRSAQWLVKHYEIEQVIEAVKWQKSRLLREKKDPATFIPNLATVEKWLDNWLGLMNKEKEELEKRKAGGYFI